MNLFHNTSLDPTDIAILNLLQKNARLTHKEIAHRTNRSLSAIQVRVKKLEELGIIERYVTLLNRKKVNRDLTVFVAGRLSNYHQGALREFRDSVIPYEQVMECYQMSGDRDFILKVVVRDMEAYNLFIQEKLSLVPHMGSVQSMFVISQEKYETAFQL